MYRKVKISQVVKLAKEYLPKLNSQESLNTLSSNSSLSKSQKSYPLSEKTSPKKAISLCKKIDSALESYTNKAELPFKAKVSPVRIKRKDKDRPKKRCYCYPYNCSRKINYPAYDIPKPGPGLVQYRNRLLSFNCPHYDKRSCCNEKLSDENMSITPTSKKKKSKLKKCCLGESTSEENFFKIFPPKRKCPDDKPKHHKLSFVDDPPYTDLHEHVGGLFKSSTRKCGCHKESKRYCRYTLPLWITNHPE